MSVSFRKKQLEDIDLFIKNKQDELNSVLVSLGWTEESLEHEGKVRCPLNPGHWIHERALDHHKEICEWVQDGYLKEEMDKQPPDSTFFYEKSQNVIPVKIDQSTLEKILTECGPINKDNATCIDFPKTYERWTVQFTPDQRLALYDFIVNASKTVEKPKHVTLEDLMIDFEKKEQQEEKPKSQLEILAEMRDYKRRRQSYRAKNVHTTRKSYTEVMKEVIENQTNYLFETKKLENPESSNGENEDSLSNKRKHTHDTDNYYNSEDSFKSRDRHSSSKGDYRRHHHSHHESSRHRSPKRKKHKRDRSRSRSPSHHKHKKSHKRKRSRD